MVNIINPVNVNDILAVLNETRASLREVIEEKPDQKEVIERIVIPMINVIQATALQLPTVKAYKDIEDYGYWMPGSGLKVKCSSCKEETYGGKTKFCPHCGIEMKEKKDVLARLC